MAKKRRKPLQAGDKASLSWERCENEISDFLTRKRFNKDGPEGVQGATGKLPGRARRREISSACKKARENLYKKKQKAFANGLKRLSPLQTVAIGIFLYVYKE